jgi:hypothetical protein
MFVNLFLYDLLSINFSLIEQYENKYLYFVLIANFELMQDIYFIFFFNIPFTSNEHQSYLSYDFFNSFNLQNSFSL